MLLLSELYSASWWKILIFNFESNYWKHYRMYYFYLNTCWLIKLTTFMPCIFIVFFFILLDHFPWNWPQLFTQVFVTQMLAGMLWGHLQRWARLRSRVVSAALSDGEGVRRYVCHFKSLINNWRPSFKKV